MTNLKTSVLVPLVAMLLPLTLAQAGRTGRSVHLTGKDGPDHNRFRSLPGPGTSVAGLVVPVNDDGTLGPNALFEVDITFGLVPPPPGPKRDEWYKTIHPTETVSITCKLTGKLIDERVLADGKKEKVESTTFRFTDEPQYLSQCGIQDGITVTCGGGMVGGKNWGPGADCAGRQGP